MTPSTGAAVRLHRNAVRVRPDSLSAFKWNACPPSPESALWTVYEGTVLQASGSAAAIILTVDSLKSRGRLSLDPFRPAIEYFTGRYFDGSDLTEAFHGLHLRSNDRRELVENVLRGKSSDDAEILSAVLIIIYRLRNNLFHGVKWSYGIKDQLENFRNANAVLVARSSSAA